MTASTATEVVDHAAMAAHLLNLVGELRRLRERASRETGHPVTFAAIVGTDGQTLLADVAELLDSNCPEAVDEDLAKHWRTSLRAVLNQ
jgi:hypothetical protein